MSAAKKSTGKSGSKAGTVHQKTRQKPVNQQDADVEVNSAVPGKPDFDQKDQNISPQRKAPGPVKRRRRARAEPADQTDAQRPPARIKNDDDSQ